MEETNLVKPTDKAVYRTVSESPGRNESEPTGGPDKKIKVRRPSPLHAGEGIMTCRNLTAAASRSGGVVGAAR